MTSSPSDTGTTVRPETLAADTSDEPVAPRPPDPHDVRLVPLALATWVAMGVGLGLSTPVVAGGSVLAGAGAVLAAVVATRRRSSTPSVVLRQAALVLAGVAMALAVVGLHHAAREGQPLAQLAEEGASVVVEAVVLTDPDGAGRGQDRFTVDVRSVGPARDPTRSGADGTVLVLAPPGEDRLRVGATVEIVGDARATGRAEVDLAVVFADEPPRETAPPTGPLGLADHLREGLRAAVAPLSGQAQGLVPGIALGDDRALPATLEDAARVTGLTHLTAVSGAHVSLVLAGVLGVVGRGRPRLAVLLGSAVVVSLVVLVRPEPSVLRAGATGGVVLLAGLLGRPARALPALATAVVVLVLVDPPLARSYGLVLSAGATAAIVVLARPLARQLSAGVPRWLAHALAIPAAAQLVCAPVLVLLDPRLALTSVPANVLAAPAVPGATVLGLGAALLSPVSPELAELLAVVASWHTAWIAWVAETLAGAPAATIAWPGGAAGVLLLAGATVACCLVVVRTVTTGGRVRALVVLVLAPGMLSLVPVAPGTGAPDGWAVRQCDVGQASALLVRTGATSAVLVDAGDADGAAAACVRDAGIATLDAVVLTHDHADHTAGLPAVLDVAAVTEVLVPAVDGPSLQVAAREAVEAAASEASVREIAAGESLDWHGVRADVLHPRPGVRASADDSSSVNESSIALLVEIPTDVATARAAPAAGPPDAHPPDVRQLDADLAGAHQPGAETSGVGTRLHDSSGTGASEAAPSSAAAIRLVVAGDLEEDGQGRLARALRERVPDGVDVVVVPHHGSGNLDPALAEVTTPLVAFVSSGLDNDHGHPAPRAVDVWADSGARVARADECGDMWLVPGGDGSLTLVGCE
ncbi:ComEC/Rec2 family competence protein [Georgenia sp. Z1344]|uniref:ComEC/Rec2 family competence protein n=1 Tax=Georgenia sp. Z1344 TaxID=3416706 RepID=UPI003CEAFBEC